METLFGEREYVVNGKRLRNRQLVVFCNRCKQLDSLFLGGGKSVSSLRCAKCGGEVTTHRHKWAKLVLFDSIMSRCAPLVIAAATGAGDVDRAVEYVKYAAHTAFVLRLAPYGPEPRR